MGTDCDFVARDEDEYKVRGMAMQHFITDHNEQLMAMDEDAWAGAFRREDEILAAQ